MWRATKTSCRLLLLAGALFATSPPVRAQAPATADGAPPVRLQRAPAGAAGDDRTDPTTLPPAARQPPRGHGREPVTGEAPAPPPRNEGSLLGWEPPAPTDDAAAAPPEDAVEPGEILVLSDSLEAAEALRREIQAQGALIRSRTRLRHLGGVLSRFRLPTDAELGDWVAQLQAATPHGLADANHRYRLQAGDGRRYGQALTGLDGAAPDCGAGVRIGLVDTGVDPAHPALRSARIHQRDLLRRGETPAAPDHGTGVAALLVGRADGALAGMVPGAELWVARAFRNRDGTRDTTAGHLVAALDWLLGESVQVTNLSLGGAPNRLLRYAVAQARRQGMVLVAAVGNQGPDHPPQYPAAFEGVIGVTAIDAGGRVFARANRGPAVDFAAPGVDLWVARAGGGGRYASGTSWATPFVTALAAQELAARPALPPAGLYRVLRAGALDLGAPGRDPVFGWGRVRTDSGCPGRRD